MQSHSRNLCLWAISSMVSAWSASLAAQFDSCSSFYDDQTVPTQCCSDTIYSVVGADGGTEEVVWATSTNGATQSDIDGFDMFDPDDPDQAPPDSLRQPFHGSCAITTVTDQDGLITEFSVTHRGRVSLGPRDSQFQSAQFGNDTQLTVKPYSIDNGVQGFTMAVDYDADFVLTDPANNNGEGAAAATAGLTVQDANQQSFLDFSGLAQLDLAASGEPQFFGGFDGPASFQGISTLGDAFQVNVQRRDSFQANTAQEIVMRYFNQGLAFTNGWDPDDTRAWTTSADNTFVLTISSDDPSVRFEILAEAAILINQGMSDAWFNDATAGQGFLIVVLPDQGIVFLAWFTYDTERPPEDVAALLGEPGHRWVTAQGPYDGDTAELTVYLTSGGVFDMAEPPAVTDVDHPIGTITIVWHDCSSATLTYDIDPPGVMGEIPLRRIVPDNEALCEALMEQ